MKKSEANYVMGLEPLGLLKGNNSITTFQFFFFLRLGITLAECEKGQNKVKVDFRYFYVYLLTMNYP